MVKVNENKNNHFRTIGVFFTSFNRTITDCYPKKKIDGVFYLEHNFLCAEVCAM